MLELFLYRLFVQLAAQLLKPHGIAAASIGEPFRDDGSSLSVLHNLGALRGKAKGCCSKVYLAPLLWY